MPTKKIVSNRSSVLLSVAAILAVLIGSAAFPTNARALGATITVTSILDNAISGDGFCTLREAITNANNNAATSSDCSAGLAGSGDVIVFSNLLVTPATITLGSALPTVSDATGLTINGGDNFTVSGNNLYRVFVVGGSAKLTLDSLTISNGKVTTGTGGGIFNAAGILTLTNCLLSGNSAVDGIGGGLYSTGGALTVTDSIFSNNSATKVSSGGYGGGLYSFSPTTITRTIFSNNSANIRGGGLYNYFSTTTVTDSTFSGNSMSSPGDGGGAIYNDHGTLTITHSTFSTNTANSSGSNGGAIFNSLGTLTITLSAFTNNSVTTDGGGAIASNGTLDIANSTFSSNYADFGGGLYNGIGGALTSTNNTFSANSSFFTSVVGGGIYNEGALNLYNTILANTVNGGDCYNATGTGTVIGSNNLIESVAPNACDLTNGVSGNIVGSDPNLGAATFLNPIYFPLNAGSPAINAGNDAKCAAAPVNNASQNGVTRPQGAHCDIGSFEKAITTLTLNSVAAQDGWVLESSETSNVGGSINSAAQTFNLGDDAAKKQYRGILSFSTGPGLPDDAVITGVTLKIKQQAIVGGGNPVSTFQGFMVDIKNGFFGTSALQAADFQTAANKTYGPFATAAVGGWYSISLTAGKAYVNKLATNSGLTQIRLRFKLDDNNNVIANYLSLFSGNAPAGSQPQLVISYYVP